MCSKTSLFDLAGLKFNRNQDEAIAANTSLAAKNLLMNGGHFKAKKVAFDPSKVECSGSCMSLDCSRNFLTRLHGINELLYRL